MSVFYFIIQKQQLVGPYNLFLIINNFLINLVKKLILFNRPKYLDVHHVTHLINL